MILPTPAFLLLPGVEICVPEAGYRVDVVRKIHGVGEHIWMELVNTDRRFLLAADEAVSVIA